MHVDDVMNGGEHEVATIEEARAKIEELFMEQFGHDATMNYMTAYYCLLGEDGMCHCQEL